MRRKIEALTTQESGQLHPALLAGVDYTCGHEFIGKAYEKYKASYPNYKRGRMEKRQKTLAKGNRLMPIKADKMGGAFLGAIDSTLGLYERQKASANADRQKGVTEKNLRCAHLRSGIRSGRECRLCRPTRIRTLTDGTKNRSAAVTPWVSTG